MPSMKWIGPIVFSKSSGNPIFGQILGHQRAKNEARNPKMNRGQETLPIRVYARYDMKWANSFFKGFWKPLQTDGRTDGQTDGQTSGWIQYTPIPPSLERGYNDNVYRKPPSHCRKRRATHGTFHAIQFDMVSGLPFIMRANRHWSPFIADTWHIGTWMGEIKKLRNSIGRWNVRNRQTVWKNKK